MPTRLVRSFYNVKPNDLGSVITMGNFDGVHQGHQKIITAVIKKAKILQTTSMVVTFEPHPFEYFNETNAIPRITRLREKFIYLSQCGVDKILILAFNQKLAEINASDFVTHFLYPKLKPQHMIIGDDFHFGYQRRGDFKLLQSLGKQLNFSVDSISSFNIEGERVSSTRVRKALANDDLDLVKKLLGRPFSLHGKIRKGDQRGRVWGFPTANIYLHRKLTPVKGVYAVYMHGVDNDPLPGVANVGIRPTVDGTRTLLEVHLLHFNRNIYNLPVKVEFCKKLRAEVRFVNFEKLKEQIASDVQETYKYFNFK